MKFFESIDKALQTGFEVFINKRLTDHIKIFDQERKTVHSELHCQVQQEFDELLSLLGADHKDLLIDYTDHLNQKYFGIDRWFYERGLMDCQDFYKSMQRDFVNYRLLESRKGK
jgi:hypothetical protein